MILPRPVDVEGSGHDHRHPVGAVVHAAERPRGHLGGGVNVARIQLTGGSIFVTGPSDDDALDLDSATSHCAQGVECAVQVDP